MFAARSVLSSATIIDIRHRHSLNITAYGALLVLYSIIKNTTK